MPMKPIVELNWPVHMQMSSILEINSVKKLKALKTQKEEK